MAMISSRFKMKYPGVEFLNFDDPKNRFLTAEDAEFAEKGY
jgi:hypothetical protein